MCILEVQQPGCHKLLQCLKVDTVQLRAKILHHLTLDTTNLIAILQLTDCTTVREIAWKLDIR